MKILVIYSNHHTNNFNSQLLDRIRSKSIENGHELVIRDLYQMNFDPVLRTRDFEMISSGQPPADIKKEQDFVRWADVLLFIYPIWWGGMPAIVKGYVDKVFSWGFAYKSNGNGLIQPLLTDKKALLINTLGQSREEYERGMFQAMNRVNEEGVFGFCGIKVIGQLYYASIHSVSEQEKEQFFVEAERVIQKLQQSSLVVDESYS